VRFGADLGVALRRIVNRGVTALFGDVGHPAELHGDLFRIDSVQDGHTDRFTHHRLEVD